MREPWFWREQGRAARLITAGLIPAAAAYDAVQQFSARRANPYRAACPVICVGNATLGGVGKTPFALYLGKLLAPLFPDLVFLTRGYGGTLSGPLLVDPDTHDAQSVGDEPLLLAAHGRTIVAKNRVAGARFAEQLKPRPPLIIMDDGFQNHTIAKDVSILLLPAERRALGNSHVFPAGPLREPVDRAILRADFIVTINDPDVSPQLKSPRDKAMDGSVHYKGRPHFTACLQPINPPPSGRLLAFCGIARPRRFFNLLATNGGDLSGMIAFDDHHPYSDQEIDALRRKARLSGAELVTTTKDAARLTPAQRNGIHVFPVEMRVTNSDGLLDHLLERLNQQHQPRLAGITRS